MTNSILRISSLAFLNSVLTIIFMIAYVIAETPLLLLLMASSAILTAALLSFTVVLTKKETSITNTKSEPMNP